MDRREQIETRLREIEAVLQPAEELAGTNSEPGVSGGADDLARERAALLVELANLSSS